MLKSHLLRVCSNAVRLSVQQRAIQQKTEKSINQVTLLGRVGRDVEMRGSDTHPMVTFSLATSQPIKSKQDSDTDEFYQKTSWHRICIFRPGLLDAVYTYCKKGDRLYVTGKLDYSEYTNDEGVRIFQTSIIADDVIFLSDNRQS